MLKMAHSNQLRLGENIMAGFENIVKKAFYMGVGFAAYAQEKAGVTLNEIKEQAQKLADEMIARGEMNVEEARTFVDDMVQQAQQNSVSATDSNQDSTKPRVIEIINDEEAEAKSPNKVDDLKQQVESLQEELRRMQQK